MSSYISYIISCIWDLLVISVSLLIVVIGTSQVSEQQWHARPRLTTIGMHLHENSAQFDHGHHCGLLIKKLDEH